jgi:hypothetical protein
MVDAGLLQEKAIARWNTTTSDVWSMGKNLDEIPMFSFFVVRGLTLL